MLRTVLGTAATNENNGKLLELADRDGDTPHFQHNGGSQLAVDDDDEPSAANIDSVITQVVVRQDSTSNQAPVQQGATPGTDLQEIRNTWKDKLRYVGCSLTCASACRRYGDNCKAIFSNSSAKFAFALQKYIMLFSSSN